MALENIGAKNRNDAFYRYKMPKMITKIEGRGNGIKTNVVNMVDIAKALARPASYTTKYFGCELGAQSKFDEKNGISLVNGAHETAKLAGLLENFIKKYVQCYGCGNPETEIAITKTQMITLKCAACGYVSDVDMRDKLTTFIIKNPPEQKKAGKDKKAMRRAEKERAKEGEMADEEMKKLRKEAVKRKGSVSTKKKADEDQHLPGGSQVDGNESESEDVQWKTDTSAEAAQQRIQEQLSSLTAGMVVLSASDAGEEKLKSEKREKSPPPRPREGFDGLLEGIFAGVHRGFAMQVTKRKNELIAATGNGNGGMLLLRGMESLCTKPGGSELLKEVALVLKALYDEDVVGEELIMDWYEQGLDGDDQNSQIWKNAKPFVEWLQSAESESEEE